VKRRVAVIGAGYGGLAAAMELVRAGAAVTLYVTHGSRPPAVETRQP